MKFQKGDTAMLLLMPFDLAKELREANQRVPSPGEEGKVVDCEEAGSILECNAVMVELQGKVVCLPEYVVIPFPMMSKMVKSVQIVTTLFGVSVQNVVGL